MLSKEKRVILNKCFEEFLNDFLVKGLHYKWWELRHEEGKITVFYKKEKPKDYIICKLKKKPKS